MPFNTDLVLRFVDRRRNLTQDVHSLLGKLGGTAGKENLAGHRHLELILQTGNQHVLVRQLFFQLLLQFCLVPRDPGRGLCFLQL